MNLLFFKTTLRYLWRHRLFTALNILGLAVSISACWIIYQIVSYEFSYDKQLSNRDSIYRVVSGFIFDEKESYNGGVPAPLYQGLRGQINGVKYVVPVLGKWIQLVEINQPSGKPTTVEEPANIAATDASYFSMVPYKWLAGNPTTALQAPESVVLTEARAKKYFPNNKPEQLLNRTIKYYGYNDTVLRTITGVVADLQTPTEFTTQEFCSLLTKPYQLNAWTNTNGSDKLYLQIKQGADTSKILKQIEYISLKKRQEFEQTRVNSFTYRNWHELLPLRDSHFSTYINEYQNRKASKPVLYSLIGIALFLLILACINYINMSIASLPQRSREIGVRKTLGSSGSNLIIQFLSETFITTLFAGLVAYVLSQLGFWLLKDIIPAGITPTTNPFVLLSFIIVLGVVVTILAGLYPSWLVTRVKAINIFRTTSFRQKNTSGFSLQKALIVFQFTIALIFISSALIVGKQLNYALTTNMGFDKEAVVLVDVPWKYADDKAYKGKQFALQNELKEIPGIRQVSMGSAPMGNNYSSSMYEYAKEGKEPVKREVYRKWIDTGYINLYGLKLLAGRNLNVSDTTNELIINETAVKAFGFASPQDALGKMIGQEQKFPVVGVVNDFHTMDFYKTIDPMAFESDKDNMTSFNIKLAGDPSQWQTTLKKVEKTWYGFYPPESFSYKFYDEVIAQLYEQEQHTAKLIDIATAISIFISCLGLFGLAVLTAFQRTKEIGIRKVLGASAAGIVRLLSKEYVYLIIIAIAIATPLAWWAMNKWLQDFAYRIQIEWWMFLLAGILAILLALITVSFQAIKAAMANPVKSLRTE